MYPTYHSLPLSLQVSFVLGHGLCLPKSFLMLTMNQLLSPLGQILRMRVREEEEKEDVEEEEEEEEEESMAVEGRELEQTW